MKTKPANDEMVKMKKMKNEKNEDEDESREEFFANPEAAVWKRNPGSESGGGGGGQNGVWRNIIFGHEL